MALNFPNSPSPDDTYSLGSRTWTWDGTAWNLTSNKVGYTGSSGGDGYTGSIGYAGSSGGAAGYSTDIGNASDVSFTVTHGLNLFNVSVDVRENSTGYFIYPDVKYVASNAVLIEFVDAPSSNQYKVSVLGYSS